MNGPATSYDLSSLTVLIVEKHQPMRTLLRTILREFGVRKIHDAASPESGFEAFNRLRPDLVLVDWCPEFDGIGLVKRIRADNDSCYPQVPVIMVSAFGEANRVCEAADAGITEYLVKPVSPNLLYVRIVTAIENPRAFIRTDEYTGPCRRRHDLPFAGKDRRRVAEKTAAAGAAAAMPVSANPKPVAPHDAAPAAAKAA